MAQEQAEAIRHIAWIAGLAGKGKLAPEALDTMLGGDAGDGETLNLGSRKPPGETSGRRRWRWPLRMPRRLARGTGVRGRP